MTEETCKWSEDNDGVWSSECGDAWFFDSGDPQENSMVYCPFCGRHLTQLASDALDRADEA